MTLIAYVINSVEGGGAALPMPSVLELLRREGFEVTVLALTGRDGRALPALAVAGIEVRVRDGGEHDHVAALGWLRRQLAGIKPDIVWTSLTRATLLGQLAAASTPIVSWQHAAFLKPANRRLLRMRHHRSALWLADSRQVASLTHSRLGVPLDRLLVWPLFAANLDAPQRTPWRPGEPIRLGSLGRLHPVKGYDVLIDALAQLRGSLPPITLTIAGEGRERAALMAQAAALGVDVALPGFAPDPAAFLAGLHLYLQPSRSEGLCVAAHEAMAAGLPVLTSGVGELPNSIVEGETGGTVSPGNPSALAAALAGLLAHPNRLAPMGDAARARVIDHFGPAAFAASGHAVATRIRAILAARAAA